MDKYQSSKLLSCSWTVPGCSVDHSNDKFNGVIPEVLGLKINPQKFHKMKQEFVQKFYYIFFLGKVINMKGMRFHRSYLVPWGLYTTMVTKYFKIIVNDDSFRLIHILNPNSWWDWKFFAQINNFFESHPPLLFMYGVNKGPQAEKPNQRTQSSVGKHTLSADWRQRHDGHHSWLMCKEDSARRELRVQMPWWKKTIK